MKRINAFLVYLMIVALILNIFMVFLIMLPLVTDVFKGNVIGTVTFISLGIVMGVFSALLTAYYVRTLAVSLAVNEEKLSVATFLRIARYDFDKIDINDAGGGKYTILVEGKKRYGLFIKILDEASLKHLVRFISKKDEEPSANEPAKELVAGK